MGATISVGKRVSAFRDKQGQVIYLLFERTYEKNCYPHDPKWGCVSFGTIEEVMRFIFLAMTSCEGGMLQNSRGQIVPETYLDGWIRELKRPTSEEDWEIDLEISSRFSATVPEDKCNEALDALRLSGRPELADELQNGTVKLSLYSDSDVLRKLYGFGGPMGAWRILPAFDSWTVNAPEFAYIPPKEVITAPEAQVKSFDSTELIASFDSGEWIHLGRTYSAVSHFMSRYGYEMALKNHRRCIEAIGEFRDLCTRAEPLPMQTQVTIHRTAADASNWNVDTASKLIAKLGGNDAETLVARLADIAECENAAYYLRQLHVNQVSWQVEGAIPVIVPTTLASEASHQCSLF